MYPLYFPFLKKKGFTGAVMIDSVVFQAIFKHTFGCKMFPQKCHGSNISVCFPFEG